jgi:multiple sugar transport system ATP-binding protein
VSIVRYAAVTKRFGDVEALKALDLEVPDGRFLALLGPSGCGKTTALRILAGLELPSGGAVYIGDRDVTSIQPRDRDIAMVFQSYALYPHMTVGQNIAYPLRIRGLSKADQKAAVHGVAATLDVGHLLDRRPRALSGGQRQRIALARAIVREPAVFLMDEPLSNLDAKLRATMRGEIKRLQRSLGTTTLYVTHDQAEAMTMADLIAVMREGVLQQLATPDDLYDRPANRFVATFVGSPAANVLAGSVDPDTRSFAVSGSRVALGDRYDACAAAGVGEIGIRPEDVRLVAPGDGAIAGEVYVVEPMGAETLVDVLVGETRVTVRADRDYRASIGSAVGIAVDPTAACFFDTDGITAVHRVTKVRNQGGGA